jgi:phosphatidate phosphatase APP1
MKRLAHAIAWRLERVADRFKRRKSRARVIEGYAGYATCAHLVLRGRVLTALASRPAQSRAGRLRNFFGMVSLFLTDEVAHVRVHAQGVEAVSDEEGYFTLLLPRPATAGWTDIPVHIEGFEDTTLCPAYVAGEDADLMIISDIDDTILETGAYSLPRNLWTSLTGNVATRHVYPDAVRLISELAAGGVNPVFYVSSSPWNLHAFLSEIFERNGMARGPMFLRDLGLSRTKFITDGHGSHKGGSIDLLLRAHPGLRVILLGDTGQEDAKIYGEVAKTHPGRIAAVVLRETADGVDQADQAAIDLIEASGIPVFRGRTFPERRDIYKAIEG